MIISDGSIWNSSDNICGATFYIPIYTKNIRFKVKKFDNSKEMFFQFGLCNDSAIMPNIITTGEGRAEYIQVTEAHDNGLFEMRGRHGLFFIGGKNFIFDNSYVEIY